MIPVFGCETARELLEPFIDGELSTDDQVAVQTHLRSCAICSARVEDLSLIGWSLRAGPREAVPRDADARDLAVIQSGVLTRIRAERSQSLRVRTAEMFSDMRLLWPAMGATVAVLLCLWGSVNIWVLTMQKQPNSLAAMLEARARAGSDSNPLPLDSGMSVPRALDEGFAFTSVLHEDTLLRIVVTTSGQIAQAYIWTPEQMRTSAEQAVLTAVKEQRFAPAARGGRPLAVEAIFYVTRVNAVPSGLVELPVPVVPSTTRQGERSKAVPEGGSVGARSVLDLPPGLSAA
jgi:anti-sigma factor RsiW